MMCASVMIAGDGIEQPNGNAGLVMLSPDMPQLHHMQPLNCVVSPTRTCSSTPGRMLPFVNYDSSGFEHWSAPSRATILSEPQWAYNIQSAYKFGQCSPPTDILAEYAQYHDTVAAQQQKILEMQYQIDQMQVQYAQYQCLLSAASQPKILDLEYGRDGLHQSMLPPSPIGGSSAPTHSPIGHYGYDNGCLLSHDSPEGYAYSFMPYGATAPCTPPYPDSPTMSVNTTPNSVDMRYGFPDMDGANNARYMSQESADNFIDTSTKPVLSLCSMASVSTVDLMNEEVYRGMGAEFAGKDKDSDLYIVRKRKWSIEEEYTASPPFPNDIKRRLSVDVSISDVVQQPQCPHLIHDEDYSTSILAPPQPTWRFDNNFDPSVDIPNVRYPFSSVSPFATEPIVNGQINHDYFRRDFYSTVWEQGCSHLFPESAVLWYPKAMASLPLSHGSTGIVSCTTGGGNNGGQNEAQRKSVADTRVERPTATNVCNYGPPSAGLLGSESSDEEDELAAQFGRGARLRRKVNGSKEDNTRPRKKGKANRLDHSPRTEKKREIEEAIKRMIDLNEEQIEMVEALKALEVGGLMVIHKRKTQKDSAMEIRKSTKCYDYLLDIPLAAEPDPELGEQQFRSIVPGVYWDKRSWIASWYEDGIRHYSSFSARMHGFYRAKYFAIQVRMYKTQSHVNLLDEEAVEMERLSLINCYGHLQC
ncbi:AP2 domain transcription factor AP2XI-5 [Babesia ovata]|uniref:AP2 domain transcription factor AP2XI-5 n=1 Tax=Babesia ovata TaxID=189622 RepID=A0A2H6KGT1_9APIC|nr:AP2 domain transcription factor AP2XI-5 [Babesia ovata]GBE62210.1 AP2 domain transcription factor AP2XI-5 [Babesia ovata]